MEETDSGSGNGDSRPIRIDDWFVYTIVSRLAIALGDHAERSELDLGDLLAQVGESSTDIVPVVQTAAKQIGIAIREAEIPDARELPELVSEGYPVVLLTGDSECWLLRRRVGSKIELDYIHGGLVEGSTASLADLRQIHSITGVRALVAKEELDCDSISSSPMHAKPTVEAGQQKPLRRLFGLLRMDARDISIVALFALVAGILNLATPLAVESLVNVVSWGVYLQPLIVLALMLLVCLGFSAAMGVLQTIVVEVIQRRQMVRIVSDLAHRFPRADQSKLLGKYPRELANRLFDIMTIQKATAVLFLDGISILITTCLGLLLLAFYHPFLLGFDIVLVICMLCFTWLLGRNGIRTAINESVCKYRIFHWLQDVISFPSVFRVNGGEALAIDRANRYAVEYIQARKQQFRVVLRQVIFAATLQVIASTVLLGLGGWLVIQGQLTLGQLVASELVVTVVVGAFSKAGKSLEKFYDLMAGIDKVGYLLDVVTVKEGEIAFPQGRALDVKWQDVHLKKGSEECRLSAGSVPAGESHAFLNFPCPTLVGEVFAGLLAPTSGMVSAAGIDVQALAIGGHQGGAIGYAGKPEVFNGTLIENVDLGRANVSRAQSRDALKLVGLLDDILKLPDGLETKLQTGGYPLSEPQKVQLMLARVLAGRPGLVVIDGLFDLLPSSLQKSIFDYFASESVSSTLIVITRSKLVADMCLRKTVLEG